MLWIDELSADAAEPMAAAFSLIARNGFASDAPSRAESRAAALLGSPAMLSERRISNALVT